MIKKILCIFLSCCILSACSSNQGMDARPELVTADLLNDTPFPHYSDHVIENSTAIFAINEEMRRFIHHTLLREDDPYERSKLLLEKLFNQSPTSLRYLNGANLTAIETYNQNTANCLSLTILAYALADNADLAISFQQVNIPEYWQRDGEYNLLTRHVNLKISGRKFSSNRVVWNNRDITIDFDPYNVKDHFSKTLISRDRVIAMFYNNKGVQALMNKEYDLAYAYFRQSVIQDETFSSVWGNLGYLYKLKGLNDYAESSYNMAINHNVENYNAWHSLAILLQESDRIVQANTIKNRLERIRYDNPYYHALLGDEAFYAGNYKQSIKHYKKARKLNSSEDIFYFGIAKAYYKLGDIKSTEFYLSKAKKHANLKDAQRMYQNKLNLFSKL